jgi:hypothetical protein
MINFCNVQNGSNFSAKSNRAGKCFLMATERMIGMWPVEGERKMSTLFDLDIDSFCLYQMEIMTYQNHGTDDYK